MKNLSLISISMISLIIFGVSCSKEKLGPDISSINGPVTIVEPFSKSTGTVDFSNNEEVYFTAKFEKETDWTVTLIGNTSGATKTIEGVSAVISKTNSGWFGTANTAPSFQVETVTARLTFKHTTDTFNTTLTVTATKNLDQNDVLITDFSTLKSATLWPRDWPPVSITNTSYPKADGGKYFYMSGTPWQSGSPYVNYMTIPAKFYSDDSTITHYPVNPDADRVFFNIMVYGNGPSDTWLLVNFSEDGVQARHLNIRPDWTGWKLISVPYTSLLPDITTAAKPNKLTSVAFVLLSDAALPSTKSVSVAFDHPTFTLNQPYQP